MEHLEESPTPEQHFGTAVRQAREVRGWTQEELRAHLAERGVRLEKTAMIRLEQGKRPIRLNEVAALAKLLGLDLQSYSGTVAQLTTEEYEEAKKKLAEATAEEEACAKVLRELEVSVSERQRDRRYWSTEMWRYGQMIAEYEARHGK